MRGYVITSLILSPSVTPYTYNNIKFTIKSNIANSSFTSGVTLDSNPSNNQVNVSSFVISSANLGIFVESDGAETVAGIFYYTNNFIFF